MEQDYRLAEGEYRFACLVWANEPLGSGQLVALANLSPHSNCFFKQADSFCTFDNRTTECTNSLITNE